MNAPRFRVDPLSDTYVTLVDLVFGFTVSQGFIKFVSSIQSLDLSISNLLVLLAYAVVILSWIGYHQSVSRYPYNKSVWSRLRLTFDLIILALYAFLIASISDLTKVLLGLSLIYSAYVITGVFRIKEWSNDRKVSRPELSFIFGSIFGLMTYISAFYATAVWVPWTLVILSIAGIFVYREIRRRLGYPRLLVVGVDVDGVLGDQVSHVLNRLHGMGKAADIQKHNITDWNYPLDGTDIALEIENALLDKRFVKEMPVVPGSIDSMEHLHKKFHAVIATSRPNETEPETIEWLRRNFEFHEYVNARDIGKENLGLDVLIDDNIDNVKAFAASSHYALLLSQPWNRNEDDVIKGLLKSKKVIRCSDWNDVEKRLDEIQKILSARV